MSNNIFHKTVKVSNPHLKYKQDLYVHVPDDSHTANKVAGEFRDVVDALDERVNVVKSDVNALDERVNETVNDIQSLTALNDLFVTKVHVEDDYHVRYTAGGLNVIDGSKTIVTKISGDSKRPRNFWKYNPYQGDVNNGLRFTYIGNGVYKLNGYQLPPNSSGKVYNATYMTCDLNLEPGKTYTITSNIPWVNTIIGFVNADGTAGNWGTWTSNSAVTFTWQEGQILKAFYAQTNWNNIKELRAYDEIYIPVIVEGSVPVYGEPLFDGIEHVKFKHVASTGRNLLNLTGEYTPCGLNASDEIDTDTFGIGINHGSIYAGKFVRYELEYPAGTYTLRCDEIISNTPNAEKRTLCNWLVFAKEGTVTGFSGYNYYYPAYYKSTQAGSPVTFTATASFKIGLVFNTGDVGSENYYVRYNNLQLVTGSTAIDFEPYREDTSFGYSDVQDIAKWEYILPEQNLRVSKMRRLVCTGDENWSTVNSASDAVYPYAQIFRLTLDDSMYVTNQSEPATDVIISNDYETKSLSDVYYNSAGVSIVNNLVNIFDKTYSYNGPETALADWTSYLRKRHDDGNPLIIEYQTKDVRTTELISYDDYIINVHGLEINNNGVNDVTKVSMHANIEQTYYQTSKIPSDKLDLSQAVLLTTDQAAHGVKTFYDGIKLGAYGNSSINDNGAELWGGYYDDYAHGPKLVLRLQEGPPAQYVINEDYQSFTYANESTSWAGCRVELPNRAGRLALEGSAGLGWVVDDAMHTVRDKATRMIVKMNEGQSSTPVLSKIIPLKSNAIGTMGAVNGFNVTVTLESAKAYNVNQMNAVTTVEWREQTVTVNVIDGTLVSYSPVYYVAEIGVTVNPNSEPTTTLRKVVTVTGAPPEYNIPTLLYD